MSLLLVMAGAAVGSSVRFLTDRFISSRTPSAFPWGTFAVNVVGSFVLGVVVALSGPEGRLLLGTGFCGALTTYSTFSYQTWSLIESGSVRLALSNVLGSVGCGVLAAAAGLALAG